MKTQNHAGYDAFESLVTAHYDMLLRLALHHTENRAEAEDIVQDVFLALLQKPKLFRDGEHAKAFLLRTVINRCKDYHKSKRHTHSVALSAAEAFPAPVQAAFTPIVQAMEMLRPEYRNVLYLHFYEQYSIREIAQLLGKSPNTVSSWLTRAKSHLREVMDHDPT